MDEKTRIIIADDNVGFCNLISEYLSQFDNIEILGIAYTDQEEIDLIEKLKPEIVITDLVRNRRYTGLEIIENYTNKEGSPEFLVISADEKDDVIRHDLRIGGYIEKPFKDYHLIIEEIEKIKSNLISKQNQMIISKQNEILKIKFFRKILDFLKIRK